MARRLAACALIPCLHYAVRFGRGVLLFGAHRVATFDGTDHAMVAYSATGASRGVWMPVAVRFSVRLSGDWGGSRLLILGGDVIASRVLLPNDNGTMTSHWLETAT